MSKQQALAQRLMAEFQPHFVKVENESYMHNSGKGANSHFKIVLVSDKFNGIRQVARHRLIYQLFAQDLANGIHALALHTYTLTEWQNLQGNYPKSPTCAGVGL
ncbi:BolA/IbaG family iron-sulfur metabolism protein [Lonepinella koalarum]|uniref:BolA family protein n=1 Tax=Lonepinella koalarum TaxID=53417 RepID=UPI0011E43E99|nr:BolA/IbaG family iron-sulfur metabolism protein [Lonepinella koalarum]TYG35007.1 BolA/IbaG family iron-sulfur metabolism protein [Lonepinella koalarum]